MEKVVTREKSNIKINKLGRFSNLSNPIILPYLRGYKRTQLGCKIGSVNSLRALSTSSEPNPVKTYLHPYKHSRTIIAENKGQAGVYRWVHIKSGKSYIGSSALLNDRLKRYFSLSGPPKRRAASIFFVVLFFINLLFLFLINIILIKKRNYRLIKKRTIKKNGRYLSDRRRGGCHICRALLKYGYAEFRFS